MSGIYSRITGSSKGLGSGLCLHSLQNTACLVGLGQLHPMAAVVLGHPVVVPSPECWGLQLQLNWTFTNSLSWALFMVLSLNIAHYPFNLGPSTATETAPSPVALSWSLTGPSLSFSLPLKPAPPGKLLHDQVQLPEGGYNLPQHSFFELTLRKHFPGDLTSMLVSS